MPYTSFAVIGAGPTIGGRIVQALVNRNVQSVVAILRPESTSDNSELVKGAKIVKVDYTDKDAIAPVFKEHNVEVVISTLAYGALQAQWPIADAAKEAGVKLFVPSEYGMPTEGGKDGHIVKKSEFAEYVQSRGIPVMRVYNGVFMEFLAWLTGAGLGKFHLRGREGDHTCDSSFTSLDDVSGFIAHVLTTLPSEELRNKTFRIEGERRSLFSIGSIFAKYDVPTAYVEELPEGFTKQTFLQTKFNEGRLSSGWDNYIDKDVPESSNNGNKYWPGHQWKTVDEVISILAEKNFKD